MAYIPYQYHRHSIRLKDYDYSRPGAYYITICTQNRACLFGKVVDGVMELNDAGQMIKKWYFEIMNKFPDIHCDQHIIMPNHIHFIIVNVGPVGADLCVCPESDKEIINTNDKPSGRCYKNNDIHDDNRNLVEHNINIGGCRITKHWDNRNGLYEHGIHNDLGVYGIKNDLGKHKIKNNLGGYGIKNDLGEHKINNNFDGYGIKNNLGEHNIKNNLGGYNIKNNLGDHKIKNDLNGHKIINNLGGYGIKNDLGEHNIKNNLGEHVGSPLHRVVQWYKTMTTNEYIRGVKQNKWPRFDGKLWQRNYYEHIIRNDMELYNIRSYIINNPLKWKDNENFV